MTDNDTRIDAVVKSHLDYAAEAAVRRYRNRALIGFLILLAGLVTTDILRRQDSENARTAIVRSGRVVAVDGCNRDFRSAQNLRSIFLALIADTNRRQKLGIISSEQRDRAITFYQERLATTTLPDCRLAQAVITDDITSVDHPPDPLYPGHPNENPTPKPSG